MRSSAGGWVGLGDGGGGADAVKAHPAAATDVRRPPRRLQRRDRCRTATAADEVGRAAAVRRRGGGEEVEAARWRRGGAKRLFVPGVCKCGRRRGRERYSSGSGGKEGPEKARHAAARACRGRRRRGGGTFAAVPPPLPTRSAARRRCGGAAVAARRRRQGGGGKAAAAWRRRSGAGGLLVRWDCCCGRRRGMWGLWAASATKRVLKKSVLSQRPRCGGFRRNGGGKIVATPPSLHIWSATRRRCGSAAAFRRRGGAFGAGGPSVRLSPKASEVPLGGGGGVDAERASRAAAPACGDRRRRG